MQGVSRELSIKGKSGDHEGKGKVELGRGRKNSLSREKSQDREQDKT